MKKLFLVATIAVAGLVFGKNTTPKELDVLKENVTVKSYVENQNEINYVDFKLSKDFEMLKTKTFLMTFCDDLGCESYEVDTSIYTMDDIFKMIDYWFNGWN
ncbi:hypothetical protein SAMN05421796_101559 [Chryseobacterium piscicola]|jgi:hypothetical protein|uniref:Uncharacterized protein n=1 Tax=Chryseobacterium piscicola TaxID=551459 RepID=A0A1N7KHE3_9FLAO|nr:hypothetical protein [Chryseobacterium piscicola]PQA96291.1 hypothetical protein B0A70_03975 [Chryseobacterium piscicola]SIS60953.1 hypothetical protein SAMN05421796_101559 [Chryseobacterium piscicola]